MKDKRGNLSEIRLESHNIFNSHPPIIRIVSVFLLITLISISIVGCNNSSNKSKKVKTDAKINEQSKCEMEDTLKRCELNKLFNSLENQNYDKYKNDAISMTGIQTERDGKKFIGLYTYEIMNEPVISTQDNLVIFYAVYSSDNGKYLLPVCMLQSSNSEPIYFTLTDELESIEEKRCLGW